MCIYTQLNFDTNILIELLFGQGGAAAELWPRCESGWRIVRHTFGKLRASNCSHKLQRTAPRQQLQLYMYNRNNMRQKTRGTCIQNYEEPIWKHACAIIFSTPSFLNIYHI
jgi:hypothetical protein